MMGITPTRAVHSIVLATALAPTPGSASHQDDHSGSSPDSKASHYPTSPTSAQLQYAVTEGIWILDVCHGYSVCQQNARETGGLCSATFELTVIHP